MLEEKELVEQTENVEGQTTEEIVETVEEPEKVYTEEEFNAKIDELMPRKLERARAKIRKELEREYAGYKEAENVLNAGLGTSNITEATKKMREFYESKGVTIPESQAPRYSDDDLRVLAANEAQKIIESGFEDVVEEVDRLAEIGVKNMTQREKFLFNQLADYRKTETEKKELAQIGVKPEALNDSDFKDFQKNLNPKMSVKEQYELYLKFKPKAKVEPIGSMKGTKTEEAAVKDFYTYEEASKFTKADFDKNPALFKAVEQSMPKWK